MNLLGRVGMVFLVVINIFFLVSFGHVYLSFTNYNYLHSMEFFFRKKLL